MKLFGLIKGKDALLLSAGIAIGSLGLKAIMSDRARRLCVQGVAAGMRAKASAETFVDQARAQVDDIVAEAAYLNGRDAAAAPAPAPTETEPEAAPTADAVA